jgi:hypothetical protein
MRPELLLTDGGPFPETPGRAMLLRPAYAAERPNKLRGQKALEA